MTYLSKVFLFFLILAIVSSPTVTADCKHKAPSKSELEEMFGKPSSCNNHYQVCKDLAGKEIECPEPKGYVCFENQRRIKIKVEFNSSNYAKRILIDGDGNYWEAAQAAEEIVMFNGRGKFLKKVEKVPTQEMGCLVNFIEEYEDLSMEYYYKNCQNSAPGGVTITWKE